jgi:hypothetical protein
MALLSLASASRSTFAFVFLWVLAAFLVSPAAAQTLTVENGATLEVTGGAVWNLHGTTLDLGGTGTASTIDERNDGRVTGGILTATRTLAAPTDRNVAGLGAILDANQVLGITTVTRGHSEQTGNGNASIARFYDITPTTNSGLSATLTLTYNEAELNGLSESTLAFFQSTNSGTSWSLRGADDRDATANTVTLNDVRRFSRWTLGSTNSPLPVELAHFDAQTTDGAVSLQWRTASETNNAGFDVQRSTNGGTSFATVGHVAGRGTTSEPQRYRFRDRDVPYAADSLVYRLRQVDVDGASHVSDPVTVRLRTPDDVRLLAPFPNPVRQTATIRYQLPTTADVTLRVFDLLGREVTTLVAGRVDAGRHVHRTPVGDLAPGTYLVRLAAEGQHQTQRFVVVR